MKDNIAWRVSICAVLLFMAVGGCGEEEAEEGKQASAAGGRGGRPGAWGGGKPGGAAAIPVKAEKVVRGEMTSFVETYARLEAERQISVMARATGFLETLSVEEGDRVRQGQVLVRLDKEELGLRMRQVRASYNEAEANYERIKILHDKKMVSQTEYETTALRFENSKVDLEEAELNLAYTDIEAPISGVIMQRLVEIGDLVRSNQEIFTIADLDPLLIRIYVPERRMYQLRAGQEATVAIEALPGQVFTGEIRMISPEVDPQSGTVKVTLEVPANGLLKPGMFSTVRIITDRHPNALIVSQKALVLETDADDVFAIEEGKVKLVNVELGYVEGGRVEIVSGLQEGQQVVTVGHEGLKDGAAVRVVGEGQPAVAAGGEGEQAWGGREGGGQGKVGSEAPKAPGGQAAWQGRKGVTPGGALPDSLRQLIASYRAEGKELPDSLRAKLRQLRGAGEQRRGK